MYNKYMHVFLRGNPTMNAIVGSLIMLAVLLTSFSLFEPIVTHGQTSNPHSFTVTQNITAEIAFLTEAADVVMNQAIAGGLTGGSSLGTTTFNVTSNNATGYRVTLAFSSTTAMNSTSSPHLHIDNYIPTDTPSDYTMSVGDGESGFAYSVYSATTPLAVPATFEHSGGDCSGSGTVNLGACWYNKADATSAEDIINTNAPTAGTGATTSILFQVQLGTNSGVSTGWYVATGTLTAVIQ